MACSGGTDAGQQRGQDLAYRTAGLRPGRVVGDDDGRPVGVGVTVTQMRDVEVGHRITADRLGFAGGPRGGGQDDRIPGKVAARIESLSELAELV